MKKSKLLTPILATAGLGATLAPLLVMTSCGAVNIKFKYDTTNKWFIQEAQMANHKAGKTYKAEIKYEGGQFTNTTLYFCYSEFIAVAKILNVFDGIPKVSIDGTVLDIVGKDTDGRIYFDLTTPESNHTINLEWKVIDFKPAAELRLKDSM